MSKIRCPSCGGLNPVGAKWCGQCHARFEPSGPPPPPPPARDAEVISHSPPADVAPATEAVTTGGSVAAPAADAVTAGGSVAAPGAEAVTARESIAAPAQAGARPGFTVADGAVRWVCARCATENDVNDVVCSVCGASFAETVRASEPQVPPRDGGTAALWSLVLPGAGHVYAGNWGQAIARAILSLWVLGMTLLAAVLGRSGPVNPFSIVFGTVAFGLWVAGSHDAYREARREPENALLKGRMFLYLVFALLGLVAVLVMTSADPSAPV